MANKIGHEDAANILREAKVKIIEAKHEEWTKQQDKNYDTKIDDSVEL